MTLVNHVSSVPFFMCIIFTLIVFTTFVDFSLASNGDRSYIFGKCVQGCSGANCSNLTEFVLSQPAYMKFLQWSCQDECKYQCMWTTVDAYQRDRSEVPQFYGKWPFVRYAGVQEPASMIFSLMNALSHLAIFYYRAKVPSSASMYRVWHLMALIGIVTWLCASVFHTRDTPTTEKMDYFSAFGLVLFNLFSLICRVAGTSHIKVLLLVGSALVGLYSYHIYYLAFIHFDYGYNMIVNVAVGAVNAVGWVVWCFYHLKQKPHWWKGVLVMLGLNALLLLELGDFPPLLWTFDAHAIWHAGTVPLNLLWYSFITDDALHEVKVRGMPEFKKML
ncbi:post-GPI attachment to proteins factor 3 [Aplysia californica]|uniref:Post-GPI attachment to proteins factor 3 n=1 Tax=Aplysia californica TaxID=6500 RepID=A0ABM0JYY9_APLCA|nr:post-GPI attachment to proteins factor 3 [Aplysia californica]XP_005104827.1 post-GPI attachment to proteins factor 3 [Aplysia californica]